VPSAKVDLTQPPSRGLSFANGRTSEAGLKKQAEKELKRLLTERGAEGPIVTMENQAVDKGAYVLSYVKEAKKEGLVPRKVQTRHATSLATGELQESSKPTGELQEQAGTRGGAPIEDRHAGHGCEPLHLHGAAAVDSIQPRDEVDR
jgi:hypothetical protein